MKQSLTSFHDKLLKMGPETGGAIYYSIRHIIFFFDIISKMNAALDDGISG